MDEITYAELEAPERERLHPSPIPAETPNMKRSRYEDGKAQQGLNCRPAPGKADVDGDGEVAR